MRASQSTAEMGDRQQEPVKIEASEVCAVVRPMSAGLPTPHLHSDVEPPRQWLGNSDAIAAVWLLGSLTCLVLAACMHVGENRQVYLLGFSQPLPETCMTFSRFGVECPGCGLTRTFVHLVHAQFSEAWRLNPVGWLVFLFACIQVPFGIAQLLFRARGGWVEAWGAWNDWGSACLVTALIVQWAVRLCQRSFM